MEVSKFNELRNIDVTKFIEKKGNLNYLSWAYAVDLLLKHDPQATWEYKPPVTFSDGTMMVFCCVVAFGKNMTAQLPVMNHRNQAIKNPDAFAVNVAMQRCLAKAIALHGIGLGIYAGEDLPTQTSQASGSAPKIAFSRLSEEMQKEVIAVAEQVTDLMTPNDDRDADTQQAIDLMESFVASFPDDEDVKPGIWSCLDSKIRSAIKRHMKAEG